MNNFRICNFNIWESAIRIKIEIDDDRAIQKILAKASKGIGKKEIIVNIISHDRAVAKMVFVLLQSRFKDNQILVEPKNALGDMLVNAVKAAIKHSDLVPDADNREVRFFHGPFAHAI